MKKNVPVYLSGLGNVAAFYTVVVKSRVDGQLMSVSFKEGDLVKEGQLLAEIDPRPYEVQRDLAEGTLARDTALLTNARRDMERYTTLLAQDAIPRQQLDTQTSLVAQYEGNIKQDTANVNSAKLNLIYSKVTAPIGGRIGLRLVDPGNIVRAADANGKDPNRSTAGDENRRAGNIGGEYGVKRVAHRIVDATDVKGHIGVEVPHVARRHRDVFGETTVAVHPDDLRVRTDVPVAGSA